VVTTADVLDGMTKPIIITDSGARMHAVVVGVDTDLNLGLLRGPEAADLPGIKMGNSDAVSPGHFAISIGNQTGQINSAGMLLVSAIRSTGTFSGGHFYATLIQISGTVGAGASGAPIMDVHGEVIGMIAAIPVGEWSESQLPSSQQNGQFPGRGGDRRRDRIENATGGPRADSGGRPDGPGSGNPLWASEPRFSSSYPWDGSGSDPSRVLRPPVTSAGFAIPINDLQAAIHELVTDGKVDRTWMGVDVRNDRQSTDKDNLILVTRRLKVTGIYPNSPAQRAGIQVNDYLVKMGDRDIHTMSDMRAAVIRLRPSEAIHIIIERSGQRQEVDIKIESRPASIPSQPTRSGPK
jgi:S1-C subfamily serine protease